MKTSISNSNNLFFMPGPPNIAPLYDTDAWIWNGRKQLSGQIQLWPDRLFFHLHDFPDGHLNLEIFFSQIEEIESFLVFNLSRLGLLIRTKDGQIDRFILNDPEEFKHILNKWRLEA